MKKIVALLLCLLLFAGLCGMAFAEVVPQGLPQVYPLTVEDEIVNRAKPVPKELFAAPISDSELGGTLYYLVGKVNRDGDNPDGTSNMFLLQTEYGYAAVWNYYSFISSFNSPLIEEPDSDYSFPEADDFVKVICIYMGQTRDDLMPLFYYGVPEDLKMMYSILSPQVSSVTPTTGESNALRKAQGYLGVSAFSYSGLIHQLEFSGFSHDEAVYAVNNCGADWFEQAAKKAAGYLRISAFSRARLIQQLEYSGFTHEQAVYGAEQNGY